jgi:UDP-glucose 4-epimerase
MQAARTTEVGSESSEEGASSRRELALTTRACSPHAVSKLTGEHYCQAFWSAFGLEAVCLRYFNVFGPRQDPNSQYAAAIPRFVSELTNDGEVRIYGDGHQTRDFTYVGNVVRAHLLAATAPGAAGAVCNVACRQQTNLLALLADLTGRQPAPIFEPARPGGIRDSLADLRNAERRLRYAARVSLQEGLRETVGWMLPEVSAQVAGGVRER